MSFSIAFLILSLLFLALMSAVHPKAAQPLETEPISAEGSGYYPSREESLTVLFVGLAQNGAEGETFVLARFDPVKGSVPIITFPAQTAVRNNGKMEALGEVFKYGGAAYASEKLGQTLGVAIERYVRMDMTAFLAAASTVGTVEFELERELVLQADTGAPVILSPGRQLLDGRKVAEIFRYTDYAGGELARCATVTALTAEIVNQRIDVVLSAVVDKVFEAVINLIDTNISYADYDDRKQAAAFMARLSSAPAVQLQVGGAYSGDGQLYTLSDTFIARVSQEFA